MAYNCAVVFDWDYTLSPHYMQRDLFKHYGVDEKGFWEEAHVRTRKNTESLGIECFVEHEYLNLILDNVRNGVFPGLNNALLTHLGSSIDLYPGVHDLVNRLHTLGVEMYIVSAGIRSMLKRVRPRLIPEENIIASEFADTEELSSIARIVCPHDKVTILDGIAQGKFGPPIPTCNIIYVGDGVTDIPAFQHIHGEGYAVGVYDEKRGFDSIEKIREDGMLDITGLANYHPTGSIGYWIEHKVRSILKREE